MSLWLEIDMMGDDHDKIQKKKSSANRCFKILNPIFKC